MDFILSGDQDLPTASLNDGVRLNSKGDIAAELHDKIVDILGFQDGSAQAHKARPNGSCTVAGWWSEFNKKTVGGWQSLLKDMAVATGVADEVDCRDGILPFLFGALNTPLDWAPGLPLTGA